MCWKSFRPILDSEAYRIEFFGDEMDRIMEIDALTGEVKAQLNHIGHLPGVPLCCAEREDAACHGKYPGGTERTGDLF